jgi:hypothetical protein
MAATVTGARSIELADEQLESVIPGAACAADLYPGDG